MYEERHKRVELEEREKGKKIEMERKNRKGENGNAFAHCNLGRRGPERDPDVCR